MLEKTLGICCDQMKKNGWSYVAGNSISPADFMVLALYHNTAMNEASPIKGEARESYQKIKDLAKYFKNNSEELKDYLATRKQLPF